MKVWEWLATVVVAVGLALFVNVFTDLVLVAEPVHSIVEIAASAAIVVGAVVVDGRITRSRSAAERDPA